MFEVSTVSTHSFTNTGGGFCMWIFGKGSQSWERDPMGMVFYFKSADTFP